MQRADPDNPPKWLICNKPMIPDMLAIDPTKMPVWEITGAQFSKSDIHTAAGISIRFPRITKQRDDKSYKEATSLNELKNLFEASKDCVNLQLLTDGLDDADIDIQTKLQGGGGGGVSVDGFGSPKKPIVDVKSIQKRDRSEDNASKTLPKKIKLTKDTKTIDKPIMAESKDDKSHKKDKPKYLFNDSSSSSTSENEDEIKKERKIKTPDIESKIKNIATVISDTKEKTREKQIISKASTMSSSSSSSSFFTTTTSRADGAIVNAMKNNEITEQQQQQQFTDCSVGSGGCGGAGGVDGKNSNITIFENVFLYVPDNELRDCLKEELRYFHLWGGTELSNPNECTHVLHQNSIIPNENCYSIRLVE